MMLGKVLFMCLDFNTTSEIPIPEDPFQQVIGQDEAVFKAKICVRQHRHLLLVGPPGTGKSMIAKAMSEILPPPTQEILVADNPLDPLRPKVVIRTISSSKSSQGRGPSSVVDPIDVPYYVAEELGFRCRRCGKISDPDLDICPYCHANKHDSVFFGTKEKKRVVRAEVNGERFTFVRENDKIRVYHSDENDSEECKVLVPIDRSRFVKVTGASEVELLGDVEHDPYGTALTASQPPYRRIIPGAIHEAHQGILFIDEISALGGLQRYLLTAMQEKKFSIVGKNPSSSGASIRVDDVPCDFILVAAANHANLNQILPSLRSRIRGDGYEVVMNRWMEDNNENRFKLARFVAQEIVKDGKIPHMTKEGVIEIIEYARTVARTVDNANGLTLRLRALAGVIRAAGDLAVSEGSEVIDKEHVIKVIRSGITAEDQVSDNWYTVHRRDLFVGSGSNEGVL